LEINSSSYDWQKKEIERIERLLASERSEFLAVTGRRRVGKTFLIDTLLKEHYCFSLTGVQNGNLTTQLVNFAVKVAEYDGTNQPNVADNWQMAFLNLKTYLKTLDKDKKQVIFIDELPWLRLNGFVSPQQGFCTMNTKTCFKPCSIIQIFIKI
jgi:uncharacterized protein